MEILIDFIVCTIAILAVALDIYIKTKPNKNGMD